MPVQLNGQDQIESFGDVETGIFTPQIADDSLNGSGECQAYGARDGRYIKIGNFVWIKLRVTTTSIGNLSTCQGTAIVGLPFTAISTSNSHPSSAAGFGSGLAIGAGDVVSGTITPNTADIELRLWDATTGTTGLTLTEWSADGGLMIEMFYEV